MIRISLCLVVLLSWTASVLGQAADAPDPTLKNYVERKDASFAWTVKKESQLGKTKYAELIMTSQTWRDIKWRHQLFILMPKSVPAENRTALLMIAGGEWRDKLADPKNETKLPSEATIFAATAEKLQMPVAVLLQVPNQPLFGDLYEDEIISHTFAQYMKTKDADWPLLLPMVKSAVRSMDTMQAYLKSQEGQPPVEKFVVTG
ncbi:MAG: PhoPQ-activated protein PqaA family protein, partial [Planctomycetota bacterium]